jgi:UDP-2,3-diacylglucosamine pyrophosphatase LpxH
MEKRDIPIVVLSDLHLGTYGCRAKELGEYLKSIRPEKLILNGDIIDIWQFRKRYFPKSHLKVLKQILSLATKGTEVYYLTGNHDEALRRFSDFKMGNINLLDKLILDLPEGRAWFFHGDIFDHSIQKAKWLAKLGGWGYDLLIRLNGLVNWYLEKVGKERYSFSKAIKNSVKRAVSYINSFENTASELAIEQGYQYVVCGHIHQPQMRVVENEKGRCWYLNSGDWIENLSALEFDGKKWNMYQYEKELLETKEDETLMKELNLDSLIAKVTEKENEIA